MCLFRAHRYALWNFWNLSHRTPPSSVRQLSRVHWVAAVAACIPFHLFPVSCNAEICNLPHAITEDFSCHKVVDSPTISYAR